LGVFVLPSKSAEIQAELSKTERPVFEKGRNQIGACSVINLPQKAGGYKSFYWNYVDAIFWPISATAES